MMRVTTNAVLKNYRYNLTQSTNNLYSSMQTVLTKRSFNSYAENPASATQAFQLRRAYYRADGHQTNNTAVTSKFQQAFSSVDAISDAIEAASKREGLSSLSDPTGAARSALGKELINDANNLMQSLNARYGDSFLFAGADGENVPFSWGDNGELLFRGINVDAGKLPEPVEPTQPANPLDPTDPDSVDEWGIYDAAVVTYNNDLQAYEKDQADLKQLQRMSQETTYVDIGIGLQEDANGNLIESSAFNSALSGLNIVGFGVDEDGDPKNAISIIKRMGELLDACDEKTGTWASDADRDEANRLQQKLDKALDNTQAQQNELSTQVTFLNSNDELLKTSKDTITEQLHTIENVDLADAITSLSWAQYCYNAALKVGNSVLSQSLIDYMN